MTSLSKRKCQVRQVDYAVRPCRRTRVSAGQLLRGEGSEGCMHRHG